MRAGIMTQRETHNASFRVFGGPDTWVRLLVFVAVARFGEDFDGGGAFGDFIGLGVHIIQFVFDGEAGGHVLHHRMVGFHGFHVEGMNLVVAASTATDDLGVEFGPAGEAIPGAGVEHDDAFACGGEVEERFAIGGGVEEFAVHADDGGVGVGKLGGGLVAVFGVVDGESGGFQRGDIGGAEEVFEVVRGTAADHEDTRFAGFPLHGRGGNERAIAFAAFFG